MLAATFIKQLLDFNQPQGAFDLKERNFSIYMMEGKKRDIGNDMIHYCVNSADRAGPDKSPK